MVRKAKGRADAGFTLFETLLTILLILSLISLPSLIGITIYSKVEKVLFIEEFQSHLLAMQNYALLANKKTYIDILKDNSIYYRIPSQPTSSLKKRLYFPKGMRSSANYYLIYLNGTGHPTSFQTITFKDEQKTYKFKFQMGSGRYIFEES